MKGENKELKMKTNDELGKEMWRENIMRREKRQREAKKCN
jgi:hypothetical protein